MVTGRGHLFGSHSISSRTESIACWIPQSAIGPSPEYSQTSTIPRQVNFGNRPESPIERLPSPIFAFQMKHQGIGFGQDSIEVNEQRRAKNV
jgi:hypothetical protein